MTTGILTSVERVLRACGRPLTAKAIVQELSDRGESRPGGLTPWKTVGARLAVDIRSNPESKFIRVGKGMYGLAAWDSVVPFDVPPRRLNPLDEDILVVDRAAMELLKVGRAAGSLFDIHYRELLNLSRSINRVKAEDDPSLVQLIPSFLIFDGDSILSFKRTRKTPEQRLHNTSSIVFGGHLQADDVPALFVDDDLVLERFLFRELHEELAFDPPLSRTSYVGVLHLDSTDFERQHAGVVFAVELHPHTRISSLEPGYHSTLHFFNWDEITSSPVMQDRWSATCITHMLESE